MKEDKTRELVKGIFEKYLEKNKYRKTPERFAILEKVYSYDIHFNAVMLHEAMQESEYRVSLATIYNTLELFQNCNLVVKHQFGDTIAQYEKTFGNYIHNHLVCSRCGTIKEFSDKKIKEAIQSKKYVHFDITHYSVYLYGICSKCKNELKKK